MCYAALALVTDMDAGVESGSGVGQAEVFALFRENLERLTGLLTAAVAALPDPEGCTCSTWADGIDLTYAVPEVGAGEGPAHRLRRLHRDRRGRAPRRRRPRAWSAST